MPYDGSTYTSAATGIMAWLRNRTPVSEKAALFAPEPAISIRNILVMAQSLIRDPKDWCQGALVVKGDTKIRRCAMQAIIDAADAHRMSITTSVRLKSFAVMWGIAHKRGHLSVTTMNDFTDHATVMTAFDEAISLLNRPVRKFPGVL